MDEYLISKYLSVADVYLAGTVMLIFGMGLYGLFISNVPPDVPPSVDRALKGSSLFGMFSLKVKMTITLDKHFQAYPYSFLVLEYKRNRNFYFLR